MQCGKWMYNQDVEEFYVITDDKTAHKKTDRTKEIDETDLGATWFAHMITCCKPIRTFKWKSCRNHNMHVYKNIYIRYAEMYEYI